MLQKAAEYIHSVQISHTELRQELDNYKNEIEQLSDQISDLQNDLPENGVSMFTVNVNRVEDIKKKFEEYVKDRTAQNWRFYIFSTIIRPLFENYVENVNISSKEEIEKVISDWQNRQCTLSQLRPRKSIKF